MDTTLQLPAKIHTNEGEVCIKGRDANGQMVLDVRLAKSASSNICKTNFSLEVIEFLIERIGCANLPNFVRRFDADEEGIQLVLRAQLLNYFAPEEFKGKRLLDFGCGCGTSTFNLARILPDTEIVGIDLDRNRIELAQAMADIQKMKSFRFLYSPAGDRLPDGIGQFDFVMLSAVYEHLLPGERQLVMPLIWSVMKEGAAVFVNQTPYRYFPYEHHSTGLWFINYLPDPLAHFVARKFSVKDVSKYDRKIQKSPPCATHLRGGIRGGTEWEIVRTLTMGKKSEARILQPRTDCARDRADYWLLRTNTSRYRSLKKAAASIFRITDRLFSTVPSMNVDVVIRKEHRLKAAA